MTEFAAKIRKWAEQLDNDLNALARQSCQEVSAQVVQATPVDTGFLRGNWQPSIGEMATTAPEAGKAPDYTAVASDIECGDIFYMTNNTAYAKRLEYGFEGKDSLGREYHQAGRYYVRDTLSKWPEIVSGVARELGAE